MSSARDTVLPLPSTSTKSGWRMRSMVAASLRSTAAWYSVSSEATVFATSAAANANEDQRKARPGSARNVFFMSPDPFCCISGMALFSLANRLGGDAIDHRRRDELEPATELAARGHQHQPFAPYDAPHDTRGAVRCRHDLSLLHRR